MAKKQVFLVCVKIAYPESHERKTVNHMPISNIRKIFISRGANMVPREKNIYQIYMI